MPGPVPSVSTKTRGYIQPPDFHTDPGNLYNTAPADASYYSSQFPFSSIFENNRNQTGSPGGYQNSYVPSYQKKVQASLKPSGFRPTQRPQQKQQQQIYRPASVQPMNLVHRQYNSPMSLYSNGNVQEVMKNHVSHISRIR